MKSLVFALAISAASIARAGPVELSYSLEVRLRSFQVDADLWAGGRLAMKRGDEAGRARYVLDRVVEDPWKFYWSSPGIGSAEVKNATEAVPAAATWAARTAVEKDAETRARARHDRWTKQWGGKRALDQSFVFLVIGPPAGRFAFTSSRAGAVSGVQNRMTDRWLPTGFPDWVAGKPVQGYGFWAADPQPPPWEPHCYHALVEALKLLKTPIATDAQLAAIDAGQKWELTLAAVPEGARAVLETLAPKTKGRLGGAGGAKIPLVTTAAGDAIAIDGKSEAVKVGDGVTMTVERHARARKDAEGVVADRVEVRLDKGSDLRFVLKIGYEPK